MTVFAQYPYSTRSFTWDDGWETYPWEAGPQQASNSAASAHFITRVGNPADAWKRRREALARRRKERMGLA